MLLLSLQKNGAGPRDALEFSNALCELKAAHTIVIAQGNELLSSYRNNEYRVVKTIPTFSSSPVSFLFSTLTLVRPLRFLLLLLTTHYSLQTTPVVFSTHFHPWLVLMPLARLLRPLQWYHAVHENPFDTKEVRSAIVQKLEQFCFNRADRIVCYSEYMRSQLSLHHYQLPTINYKLPPIVLPVGAYTTALDGVAANQSHKKEGRLLVGCLGRIEPYKDIDTLLKAFELLNQNNLPVDLLIAGRGPLPQAINYKLSTTNFFIENRWLSSDEITALALECDIIVVPYKKASQSGIIALALAAGKPVIATNVGGLAEQIEDGSTGIVVPPGDPEALARAMESLLADPEKRSAMGMAARALGSDRLSWKRGAEEFLKSL